MDYNTIWNDILKIRSREPLIHNITNYVVMNSTANAILAIGASPVMAHAIEEVEEMTSLADALVLNIGTLEKEWIESMLKAAKIANERRIPVILDPVGAGATKFRTETIKKLLNEIRISILRGNASEIKSLADSKQKTKGVDATITSLESISEAKELSKKYNLVISISGEVDLVINGNDLIKIYNGHKMMSKVTGMGCIATAITGVFAAINDDYFIAAAEAMAVMGIAGEIAAQNSKGTGSMGMNFLDALYNLSLSEIKERLKIEFNKE